MKPAELAWCPGAHPSLEASVSTMPGQLGVKATGEVSATRLCAIGSLYSLPGQGPSLPGQRQLTRRALEGARSNGRDSPAIYQVRLGEGGCPGVLGCLPV